MLRLTIFGCFFLSLTVGHVVAGEQEVPDYPVERWCKEVAKTAGDSEIIYGGCIQQEQSAYDDLKVSWTEVPRKTQIWCKEVAKASGPGSYMILKGCVEQEAAAQKENTTRHFVK
ncbi:MAG TPA: hypothetical protein VK603_13665 [Candidatus Saccharimonadales bacterium]|nr:hypothetical protein [Candidatus Saccharimonadales bacterium]